MKVTVLRGISGAGKTTWTKTYASSALIVTADRYFTKDGIYEFDPRMLQENHNKCFYDFMDAILKSAPWIVVDNTNVCAWEYSPYILAAQAYGYEAELLTLRCPVETSLSRKDQVPPDELRLMSGRLDEETQTMPKRFKQIHRVIDVC